VISGTKSNPTPGIPSTSRPCGASGTNLRDPRKNEDAARSNQVDVSPMDRAVGPRFRTFRDLVVGKILSGFLDGPGCQRGGSGCFRPGGRAFRRVPPEGGGAVRTDPRRPRDVRRSGREAAGGFPKGRGRDSPSPTSGGAPGP